MRLWLIHLDQNRPKMSFAALSWMSTSPRCTRIHHNAGSVLAGTRGPCGWTCRDSRAIAVGVMVIIASNVPVGGDSGRYGSVSPSTIHDDVSFPR